MSDIGTNESDSGGSTATPPPTGLGPLEYAPGEPLRRRKRLRRIVAAVLLLALLTGGLIYGPRAWRMAYMRYVVRQCSNFAEPSGTVVYDDDPSAVASLLGAGQLGRGTFSVMSMNGPAVRAAAIRPDPACYKDLGTITTNPGYFLMSRPKGPQSDPLVFLHERRTPAGLKRIVSLRVSFLTYHSRPSGGLLSMTYTALLIEPRGWDPPTVKGSISGWGGVDPTGETVPPPAQWNIRLLAAEIDPNDAGAFSIPYDLAGKRHEFKFRLIDKKGTADLQIGNQPVPATTTGIGRLLP